VSGVRCRERKAEGRRLEDQKVRRAEIGGQKSEVRGQKSEVRGQKVRRSEGEKSRDRRTENRSQR